MATKKAATKRAATAKRPTTAKARPVQNRKNEKTVPQAMRVVTAPVSRWETVTKAMNSGEKVTFAEFLTELFGTFLLTALFVAVSGNPLYIFFGYLVILLMIGRGKNHLNPAVSVASWLMRNTSGVKALVFILAQFVGAMIAYLIVSGMFNAVTAGGTGSMMSQAQLFKSSGIADGKEWLAVGAELLGAIIFGFGIAKAFVRRNSIAASISTAGSFFVALLVPATLAITTVVLNPAIALAIQAFNFSKGFSQGMLTIAVWVLVTIIGVTIGMALQRVIGPKHYER